MADDSRFSNANEEFSKIIANLEKEPDSFLNIMEFNSFLKKLPFGTISDEQLKEYYERVSKIEHSNRTTFMFKLLDYETRQDLAGQ